MFQPNIFKNQVALVTGGATGIGYEIARQFLQSGCTVWIASRKEEKLKKAFAELTQIGDCHYATVDVREITSVEKLAEKIAQKHQKLDILVNNAGGQFLSPAEKISWNGWNAVINNNLNGTWAVTKTMACRLMIPANTGKIINIIAQIYRGFPGMAHTGAARAGVDNLTKTLAVEWAKYNLRINAIAPGVIASSGLDNYPPEVQSLIQEKAPKEIPLQKLGTVADVAFLVLFLASSMADYITGETIYVDGGQRLSGDLFEV